MSREPVIRVHQLQLFAKIGVTQEERAFPQRLVVDLELQLCDARAAESDRIEQTVDYMLVLDCANRLAEEGEFHLVEKFAGDLVSEILRSFPLVARCATKISKFVDARISHVSVELEATRDQEGESILSRV